MKNLLFSFIFLIAFNSYGQKVEIGQWRDYLPYNNAISLAKMNGKIYVATKNSLFYLDLEEEILNRLIFPEYLIIKIPSRDGLLFNIAYFLAKFKIHNKFLHQLLQVGTFPPHYFYFSKKGLLELFSKFNYEPIHISSDLDYEISSFGSRLNVKGIQKIIFNLVIPFLSLITKISNSHDSKIIFLRLKKNPIIPI